MTKTVVTSLGRVAAVGVPACARTPSGATRRGSPRIAVDPATGRRSMVRRLSSFAARGRTTPGDRFVPTALPNTPLARHDTIHTPFLHTIAKHGVSARLVRP